jgi:uncharacterized protein YndB with AHSA1/START domain
MKKEPFVIERTLNAPAERVWKAITDPNDMKQWYFDVPAFKPEVGNEFTFTGGSEDRIYVHLCRVTEIVPGTKITYSWRYEGFPGNSFVTFELFPEGNKTKIRLTHVGLETFPQDKPDFAKESFAGGWTHIIGKSLPEFLDKEAVHQ